MKKVAKIFLLLGALLASVGTMGSAHAGLIGDTVGIRYVGASDTGTASYTVGAGEEGNFFANQFFDFGDSDFAIRSTAPYCGIFTCSGNISLILSSLDLGTPLTNVTFNTNLVGVSMAFDSGSVTFSWAEQEIFTGTYLTAVFNPDINDVPEPASIALLGFGLAGLAVARRRTSGRTTV